MAEKDSGDRYFGEVSFGILGLCIFMTGMQTCNNINSTNNHLKELRSTIEIQSPEYKTENVMGGSEPETFYEIDGKRAYLKIDGNPIGE